MIFDKDKWLLIVGRDLFNDHWGITLNVGPLPPLGDWRMWKHEWRINVRWPVTYHSRHRRTPRRMTPEERKRAEAKLAEYGVNS